jgi:hypothetical protein
MFLEEDDATATVDGGAADAPMGDEAEKKDDMGGEAAPEETAV